MNFANTYTELDDVFFQRTRPVPVQGPQLFLWNSALSEQLMIPNTLGTEPAALAQVFSGNQTIPESAPMATVYAGHQFGNFVPRLGDGRAHLLGEVLDRSGKRWDIQLKGSGPTAFSRGGDGRCAIGPAIRELVMSEAMHALGVPTTRCLAVVTTGETVFREKLRPGAVVTRVASSHMRIGTFEYFAARRDLQSLKTLCDYAISRHDPELEEEENRYVLFLEKVMDRQVQLVVEWMRVGFIHGVMNTDNTTISGETIDYGPCAMMGIYDPETVYSSIDTTGRYAFGNQPRVLHWNLARLAESLLPVINADPDKAAALAEPVVAAFPEKFHNAYVKMLGEKLGFAADKATDENLIFSLLNRLRDRKLDYTVTFDRLTRSLVSEADASRMKDALGEIYDLWRQRLSRQNADVREIQKSMRQNNPVVIPRNHHMEAVIAECEKTGEAASAEKFLHVLRSPYEALEQTPGYQDPPSDNDKDYKTFCGT